MAAAGTSRDSDRGDEEAKAKESPRESERTERCREILWQLRALEPERDKTG